MTSLQWPLQELQTWFSEVTTHPGSLARSLAAQAWRLPPRQLDRVVLHGPHESALDRLEIYHRGYFSRLFECIADDFPAVRFAVGDSAFDDVCRMYVDAHPSRGPNLNLFGHAFAEFLRGTKVPSANFVAELARLEWSLIECVHASAPDPLSPAALAALQPHQLPGVRFKASGALRLLSFTHPVNAFLQAFYDEQGPVLPQPGNSHVAVVRQATTLWRFDLSDAQNKILTDITRGQPLDHALLGSDATAAEVQAWFGEWTRVGFFTGICCAHT